MACGILKRRASSATKDWDDKTNDALLQRMASETVQRDDPTHGNWCAERQELNVLVDARSLAIGVALERYEAVLEDACWLRPKNDAQHINLAELDAVLKDAHPTTAERRRVSPDHGRDLGSINPESSRSSNASAVAMVRCDEEGVPPRATDRRYTC